MTIRTSHLGMGLLACALSLPAPPSCPAAEPPKPTDLEGARQEVLRALEQFRAAETRLREAENRLRELEGKTETADVDYQVYRLKNTNAADLAGVLSEAFGKGRTARAAIVADPATNSLLVRARADDRKTIEGLIRKLDAESTDSKKPQK